LPARIKHFTNYQNLLLSRSSENSISALDAKSGCKITAAQEGGETEALRNVLSALAAIETSYSARRKRYKTQFNLMTPEDLQRQKNWRRSEPRALCES
jgi:flagellar capping protein FliD